MKMMEIQGRHYIRYFTLYTYRGICIELQIYEARSSAVVRYHFKVSLYPGMNKHYTLHNARAYPLK
jgi:hypothetical protein